MREIAKGSSCLVTQRSALNQPRAALSYCPDTNAFPHTQCFREPVTFSSRTLSDCSSGMVRINNARLTSSRRNTLADLADRERVRPPALGRWLHSSDRHRHTHFPNHVMDRPVNLPGGCRERFTKEGQQPNDRPNIVRVPKSRSRGSCLTGSGFQLTELRGKLNETPQLPSSAPNEISRLPQKCFYTSVS